ncbi:tyrosine-type recombinase/integrase [Peptacetobacter sp.]|uniref:tyrosine-type recombinase/integrase n=1 Tax=Peptacetobacter sp. TaxID=2991975 RepID=UPI002E791099|nr:tyrosine-type recombinase/integrase [Peptacetobacter sp.]MEE0451958.1 tyrosine-type recombinase/integrase [Peptacetobacter sp.]
MGTLRKRGNSWYFSVELPSENGKRKRIERAGGKTKKEAQEKMKLFEAEILKNGYKEESKITFKELSNNWLENYVETNCKDRSKSTYERMLRLHIVPRIGNYRVVDIKPKVINDFYNTLKEEDYNKSTAELVKSTLNGCLNFAVFPGEVIASNPCSSVKFPKFIENTNSKDVLTQDDLELILEKGEKYYNFNEMCILLFNTGMRIGEALALQWEDIDFKEKIIHIKHNLVYKNKQEYRLTTPKTKKSIRDIYFNAEVEKVFKRLKKKQNENKIRYGKYYKKIEYNLIFTTKEGNVVSSNNFTKNALRLKDYREFSMHTFRHTHATMLLQAGANIKDVQARLGHTNINTTMDIYVHSTNESKKNTLKKFDEYIKTSNI